MATVAPAPISAALPRVAVIVPAYGVAHMLGEALGCRRRNFARSGKHAPVGAVLAKASA